MRLQLNFKTLKFKLDTNSNGGNHNDKDMYHNIKACLISFTLFIIFIYELFHFLYQSLS